jgi:hypothetical protein
MFGSACGDLEEASAFPEDFSRADWADALSATVDDVPVALT